MIRVAVLVLDRIDEGIAQEGFEPIGAMTVVAALQEEGFEAQLFAESQYESDEEMKAGVIHYNPGVIGFSTMTRNWLASVQLAQDLEVSLGRIPVVFGGWHTSGIVWHARRQEFPDLWQELLCHPNWYAVEGEGMDIAPELVRVLLTGGDINPIQGIAYSDGGKLVVTAVRPRRDPKLWTIACRDGFASKPPAILTVVMGAGCHNSCVHCQTSRVYLGGCKHRPIQQIIAEIELLVGLYGPGRKIWLLLEDSTSNPQWLTKLCQAIIEAGLYEKAGFVSFADAADFDGEGGSAMLCLMKEAGWESLLFGIETTSPAVLACLGRQTSFDHVKGFVEKARVAGLGLHGTVMIGYPEETEEQLLRSLQTIQGLDIRITSIMVMPLPGTPYYVSVRTAGLLREDTSFADYDGKVPIIKTSISPARLQELRQEYTSSI